MKFFLILLQPFLLFYAAKDIRSRWLTWIYIAAAILFTIGLFFTINHWPYGRQGLIMGLLSCMLIFGHHFINDFNAAGAKRGIQDYLLLIWLLVTSVHFMRTGTMDEYTYQIHNAATLLLWVNLAFVLYRYTRSMADEE